MRRRLSAMFALAGLLWAATGGLQAAEPLAYVPPSSSVFIHVRVGDLLKSPLALEIRKSVTKELEAPLGEFKKEIGVALDDIDTATFFYPTMPQGPGDEKTFVVVVSTNRPYDRNALLPNVRNADAKVDGNTLKLKEGFTAYFPSDTVLLVMHDSLVKKFAKEPAVDAAPNVMTEALQMAKDKRHFVFSIDFSKLPNELFTAAPPQLQPFLPILKSKSSCLFAQLNDRKISINLNFVSSDNNAAEDAERSFKLLMKLAQDGLASVKKDEGAKKEAAPFMPIINELERGFKDMKIARTGARLENSMELKVEQSIGTSILGLVNKNRESATRAQGSNNLKQIALAMHNYHDVHNGMPAASICDKKGKPLLSWRVAILPYIEQQALYNEFKLDEPWDSEHNKKLIAKMPRTYGIQDAKTLGKTHYRVFVGGGAVFDAIQQTRFADITDGTSNTVMIAELAEPCEWSKPDEIEFDEKLPIEKLLLFVDGRTTVAFCDGSVRMLKKGLGDKTWRLLIQKADGNPIPDLE